MARPTKLTPEVQNRIVSAIRMGNHLEVAAAAGGIAYSTFRMWQLRGQRAEEEDSHRRADRPFLEFLEATSRASYEAEAYLVGQWSLAASTDWRAAESLLARRFPLRWARSQDLHWVVDTETLALVFDIVVRAGLNQDQLDRVRAEFAQLMSEGEGAANV